MWRYFFQKVFDSFLFIPSLFLFFHKNYYHFTKGKEPAQSPKPDSFEFDLFTVDISSQMTPARLCRSRLDAAVQSSVALLGVIRCSYNPSLFGHGLGLCPKNPLISEVSSVSYEQICVFFFQTMFDFFLSHCVILNAALLRTHLLRRMFRDLTFIFSKGGLNLFYHFFVFIFFIKLLLLHLRRGKQLGVRSPQF